MFGFISNFKKDVVAGFDAVHQRLITLEAQVAALFEHTKQTAGLDVGKAVTDVSTEVAVATNEVKAVETTAEAAATVVNDAKQV